MIVNGDCLTEMAKMEANSVSAIITDPPYGLHFMGKDWDKFKRSNFSEDGKHIYLDEHARSVRKIATGNSHAGTYDESRNDEFQDFMYRFGLEALRVCKPGAFLLMCGAPRRFHRQACGLEDAGWEIRDCVSWLYGQGFPKSHNHFGLPGYGTALKPAWEPILVCMKPCDGTFAQSAEKWGQAGINIDGCRIDTKNNDDIYAKNPHTDNKADSWCVTGNGSRFDPSKGRWPANLILDEVAAEMLDQQSGMLKSGGGNRRPNGGGEFFKGISKQETNFPPSLGGASRFFYCAKASTAERNKGCGGLPLKDGGIKNDSGRGFSESDPYAKIKTHNNHPTVKPIKLMEYLVKLIAPPKDALILDPFMGSGTTLLACQNLGISCVGIELSADYCEIARARLSAKE